MDVNLRAPALLTQAFARAVPAGAGGLVVNMLDAKLAAPNPDFFSYTVAKMGLAGFTELAARALAARAHPRLRRSRRRSRSSPARRRADNFAAVHALNPLAPRGRGRRYRRARCASSSRRRC